MASSSSGSPKVCFNSSCNQSIQVPTQGWLCRTGDFADLCDRCGSAFKDGKFCDTYHLNASGWRCCESCGKKIHCGCIVSFHMFVLLDAGGIECLNCAKTEYILTPNPSWPPASQSLVGPAEKIRDVSAKNWRYITGSGYVPSPFGSLKSQHELQLTSCSPGQSKIDDSRERIGDRTQASGIRYDVKHSWLKDEIQAHNETRAHHQLLQRNWPEFKDQEHQQLCGGSNAKITPLFEKVLSASDAGKMGRLVLPKKYAEAYLPPISEPEGCPLVIQDLKGKHWVLQYRFWPNNNSRIYVLEGMTPWTHSMQLQAGDTVTFGRLEPEGTLIMGFRKASLVSTSHKGNETTNTSVSIHAYAFNDSQSRKPDGTWSEVDNISNRAKRKKMCSNSKHLKLGVTLERVQGLLQTPISSSPAVVLIDGVEFEIFQEAPIIGSPTELSTDGAGSLRLTEVEPTPEHLEHKLPMINLGLADVADRDGAATTKHPRHKHSCTCVVCIQPPSMMLYADIIRYTQMANSNSIIDHKSRAGQSQTSENDPSNGKSSGLTFKSQNIDLNIRPELEEEPSEVAQAKHATEYAESCRKTNEDLRLFVCNL